MQQQLCDAAWVIASVQQLCHTGDFERALALHRNSRQAGVNIPDAEGTSLFGALATAAIRAGRGREAAGLVRECCQGPGSNAALVASLVKLCCSKQLFGECLAIYDAAAEDAALRLEDTSIWSLLLLAASETKAQQRSVAFLAQLKAFGSPSVKDYSNMIRCAAQLRDWRSVHHLLQEACEAEVDLETNVCNVALAACVGGGRLAEAQVLLGDLEAAPRAVDVVTYNTVAKGYAKAGCLDECFKLVRRMRSKGIEPSQITYGILLDGCLTDSRMEQAAEVFNEMTRAGHVVNTVIYTMLIKGFAKAEKLDQAMQVYDKMRAERDNGISPDLITYSVLVKANCDAGCLDVALTLFRTMKRYSLRPDEVIYNNLLDGCAHQKNVNLAKQLYADMLREGLKPSSVTYSILVRLYTECKLLDEAVAMLTTEPRLHGKEPEPRIYTQLAHACLRERQGQTAVEVCRLMLGKTAPSSSTHSSLLGMCMKANMLDTGAELLDLMAEFGGRVDVKDAVRLRDAALRKHKSACAKAISAAIGRLGLAAAAA